MPNSIVDVLNGTARFAVVCGDTTEVLKTIPDECAHTAYLDPPYGLSEQTPEDVVKCLGAWLRGEVYTHHGPGFMGKDWDSFVPGPEAWREVRRVLKPGAYCVAFSSTRTVDLLGISMRIAGLEVREGWAWLFGSGFPKSMDVGKAIAKVAGGYPRAREAISWMQSERERQGLSRNDLETKIFGRHDGNVRNWEEGISVPRPGLWAKIREALGHTTTPFDSDMERGDNLMSTKRGNYGYQQDGERWGGVREIREPATDAAKLWSGYGTTTKPAFEPLMVTRKPPEGTIASNVVAHGCGVLNIDGSRIGFESTPDPATNLLYRVTHGYKIDRGPDTGSANFSIRDESSEMPVNPLGRFPASLALIHDEDCQEVGTIRVKSSDQPGHEKDKSPPGMFGVDHMHSPIRHGDEDGTETVTEWRCTPTCAVAELARQSGELTSGAITAGRPNGSNAHFDRSHTRIATRDVPADVGTAARFFYQGKATGADRLTYLTCSPGCQAHDTVAPDHYAQKVCPVCKQPRTTYQHPTVKPYELAKFHARLLSLPPSVKPIAIVPFCGTGIEARALMDVGFRVIAIDIDPRHVKMTLYRLSGEQPVPERPVVSAPPPPPESIEDLFGF